MPPHPTKPVTCAESQSNKVITLQGRWRAFFSFWQWDVLTVKEIADYLMIDKSTVYKHIKRGLLDSFRIGGKILVTQQALDDFINLSNIGGRQ